LSIPTGGNGNIITEPQFHLEKMRKIKMKDLVIMKNKQAVTTSLGVADVFEKRHDHILRDIDKLKKDVPNFGEMSEESQEPDS
jgi:hypothetical protein